MRDRGAAALLAIVLAADPAWGEPARGLALLALGGHDAAGILDGRLVDADPGVFAVIDGWLYPVRDAERRARVLADPGLVRAAEAAWSSLRRLTDGLPR